MRRASGGRTALVCSYYSVEINWVRRRLPALVPFLRWSVRTADAVTAISHATAEAVRDLESLPVAVVPYGAALEDDGAGISRPAFAGGDPLRLLFVGRLVERKGVEVLVRALAKLRAEKPATLTVIGEGKWAGRIRAEVSRLDLDEMVRFTGHVSADRLAAEYEAADILVLPAVVDSKGDTEGLGVVILEGLRFERPVVASEVGGVVDIVREGESGWLVPPGDADALAARLLEVAANPERAREVAARGRTMAGETFSWPRILAATRKVYELAMERRGRRP
jgi:glycosyltransferase involved in cell wall biosynthesis